MRSGLINNKQITINSVIGFITYFLLLIELFIKLVKPTYNVWRILVKQAYLYTQVTINFRGVDKSGIFTSLYTKSIHKFTHKFLSVFTSVSRVFLPTIHKTYKGNYMKFKVNYLLIA